jgi:hypothetical protein
MNGIDDQAERYQTKLGVSWPRKYHPRIAWCSTPGNTLSVSIVEALESAQHLLSHFLLSLELDVDD